jgi:hypothetical protein
MRFVFTPDWFLGKDVIIDVFSFLVLLVFFMLSLKNYKISNKRSLLYLGVGFGLIGLAQLASILTKLVLYFDFGPSQQIGQALVNTYQVVSSVDVFYLLGFFFFKFLMLSGFYILYRLPRAKESFWDIVVLVYFLIISTVINKEVYYLFNLTSLVLLALIVIRYVKIYQKNMSKNTLVLIAAFSILGFAQLIFLLSPLETFFVLGEIFELISYLILLGLAISFLKYGSKKKSNGHNIRHTVHNTGKRRKN